MALKTLIEEWSSNAACFMCQQLSFDAMNAGRLLQSFDYVSQQPDFDFVGVGKTLAVGDVEIADDSFAAFIDEESVAEDAAAFDGGVTGKDFGIDVAQNHFRRTAVIPREQTRPQPSFAIEQGSEIGGRKMSEIENLHGAPAKLANSGHVRTDRISSLVRCATRGKRGTGDHQETPRCRKKSFAFNFGSVVRFLFCGSNPEISDVLGFVVSEIRDAAARNKFSDLDL